MAVRRSRHGDNGDGDLYRRAQKRSQNDGAHKPFCLDDCDRKAQSLAKADREREAKALTSPFDPIFYGRF